MKTTSWLILSACLLLLSSGNPALAQTAATRGAVTQVTVPLLVEGNRPFVDSSER